MFLKDVINKLKENPVPKPLAALIALALPSRAAGRIEKVNIYMQKFYDAIAQFVPEASAKQKRSLSRKLVYNRFVYQIAPAEYFLFSFENLNDHGKRTYIGDNERWYRFSRMNTEEIFDLFDDKYKTYQLLKDYFKREIILLKDENDLPAFKAFAQTHEKALIKPYNESLGRGVYVMDLREPEFDAETAFHSLIENGNMLVEELIVQSNELAVFHPASVNSVRYCTFFDGNEVWGVHSFLRMGSGDSVVDNAGAGGIFAMIDIETGIIITAGHSKAGKTFIVHPDSGVQIVGFHIPRWEELLKLVDNAARLVSFHPYVGWDLALTDNGWCIIEANARAQLSASQICDERGRRKHIEDIFGKDLLYKKG